MSRPDDADRRGDAARSPGALVRGHRRALADAARRLRAAPWAHTATLTLFALALLLPLLLALGLGNARRLVDSLGPADEIGVFLEVGAEASAAQSLAAVLRARPDVAAVVLRSPEQGLAEWRRLGESAEVVDALEDNPLPYALFLAPRATTPEGMTALLAFVRAQPGVASLHHDADRRARLDAWVILLGRLVLALALLLALGAMLVVAHSVRLDLAARRDEIDLLQCLGADDADIRRPTLYFGALLGLGAGLLALAGALALGLGLQAPLAALLASGAGGFVPSGPTWGEGLGVSSLGAALGWLGARVASGHYLQTSRLAPP